MNTPLTRLFALLCLLLALSGPSVQAASLSGESVTLTVTCSGIDSNAQPYNIVLHTSTFTVGAGVEVSGVAVSGAVPNPGFSPISFSGTITVDVGANTMSCRYQGMQGIGTCTFTLSSVADQSAGQISTVTLTSESGFQSGLSQSQPPASSNTGTGSVSANFFWGGTHSPVDQNELVTFTLLDATAPVLANLNGDIAAFTGSPVVVDVGANMTITDNDAPSEANIGGATVTITNFQAGDVLAATPTSPITASYTNGVLTLSGTSTRTNYRNALRAVTFSTSSGNSTTRSISTVVTDTTARSSTAAVSSVTVTPAVTAPVVTTPTQSAVAATSATLGGNVTSDGGASISARGVVVSPTSLNNYPLIGGANVTNLTTSGTTGVFTVNATGLAPNTGYSFKAYATNAQGTTYTSPVSTFTTPALPNLSINDVTLAEGNSGTTNFTFTVSLSAPAPAGGVTFDIATANGTASSPGDFTANSLTGQTIAAGNSSATFTVQVNGDTSKETNEVFFVNVTNVTGANVSDGQGQGTITNDDFQADLSITVTDGAATEVPGTGITYTIVASNAGPDPVVGATVADTFPASLSGVTWTAVGAGGGTVAASGSGNINETVNLPVGGSVTFTVNGTISASATGTLSNTATIASSGSVVDPSPANNSSTDTDTLSPQADLSITKTDGVTTAVPGGSVTYTITVSNAGPSNAPGSTVADTFPASLTATWTAVGAGGGTVAASGSGNINETVNLPAGGSVTFTVSATIAASATGTLSNTATVAAPGGVTDPTPGNNNATDSDTLTPQADLAITVTDGVTSAIPGGSVTYTITVSNAGPSNAPVVSVADTFPASLTATWTGVGAGGGTGPASGSGNINATSINLPAGGSFTFTVSASISASATGSLTNTATVSSSTTDPTPANNSATDTDTLTPQADLSITKTDGVTTAVPGGSVTYTITVSNAGPSNAPGSTVADTFPASLTATWTAVGSGGGTVAASGSGNINETLNLPAGGSVTFTVSATIAASATGTLSNTATVAAPAGVTDPTPGNNSATDSDTLTPQADLSITVNDGVTNATPGGTVTYTITASNAGPSNAPGSTVADTFPAALNGVTWTAVGAGGGTVTASGSGNINETVNLPAGGSVTFTATGTINTAAFGTLTNTATVSAPGGVTDPTPGNNSASDSDSLSTVVSITATDADADENTAATGTWRVLRNGTSGNLTVQLAIDAASTAKPADWTQSGATFATLDAGANGSVVIPDGQDHVDITLTPTADLHAEAAETAILNVTADAAYTLISPSSATVTIGQNDFLVINTDDSGEGSLRQAVLNANAIAGDDTITFDATVFATAKTITLTSGQIVISGNTTVQGTGAALLAIDGNAASRIFNINNNAVVLLADLTMTNGSTTSWGGALNVVGGSNATLLRGVVRNSSSQLNGGGIYASSSTLTIVNSLISGNSAATIGGGAISTGNGPSGETIRLINSTLTGNSSVSGGALYFGTNPTVSIVHSTLTGNSTTAGGGAVTQSGGTVTVSNSIIAGNANNTTTPDVAGSFTSGGGNVIGNVGTATGFTATGDVKGTGASPIDPLLGPLSDNGGPTLTHLPLNGSPAINNGIAANLPADAFDLDGDTNTTEALPVDQRGLPNLRTRGPAPDAGATEAFAFEPTLIGANTDEDTLSSSGLVITANPADGDLTSHYKITNILNGTLYQNDGVTVIPEGGFITKAEGAAGLKFLPGLNLHDGNTPGFGFSAQAAVSAADAGLRGAVESATITVNSVNDAPTVVAPGIPDQTLIIGGYLTLTLPDKFTDVDGDTLAFSVVGNSKSSIATATVIGTSLKLAALDNGVTIITVQAGDGLGGTVVDSFTVQVGTSALTTYQPIKQKFKVNRGNGLFEVKVKITNTTPLPVNGFRLHVNFDKYLAKYPSLRLQNASSPDKKKNVYVDYRGPVAVDGTVTLKLSFYTKDRKFPKRFKPAYAVETFKMFTAPPLLARGYAPGGAAVGLSATVLPDRSVRIGFPATAGSWYRVSYSTDLKNWVESPVLVRANDSILYWTDSGPPVTATHPADGPRRFYRIHEVTAP